MRSLRIPLLLALSLCASCKKSPMGRVEVIRDELTGDSPRFSDDLAACGASANCASDVAQSIGGTFDNKKPDQISAAAVAVVVARDHHGSAMGSPDVWLAAMRIAKGPGADALRLATARELASIAGKHAHALDADLDARAFMADVAKSIPGACKTYELLGGGADADTMPPVDSPDHAACVQRDLARKEGPGAGYGQGLHRGVAGAFALWKEAASALHDGSATMDAKTKAVLDARLATIDAATPKIVPKHVDAPPGNAWNEMKEEHETPLGGDAGAPTPKKR